MSALVVQSIEAMPGPVLVPMNVAGGTARTMLPATTPLWSAATGQAQPVMVVGSLLALNVAVAAPDAPQGNGYMLTAWLATADGQRVALFSGGALCSLPFTAEVVLQVVPTGFVAITGAVSWELTDSQGGLVASADVPTALYFVPKAPTALMPQGLPVELLDAFTAYAQASGWHLQAMAQAVGPLRLLGYTLSMAASAQPVDAAEQVAMATLFCFNHNPPVYNSRGGGKPGYTTAIRCSLLGWTKGGPNAVCSCEDQTAVLVLVLSTFFGRSVRSCGISGGATKSFYWITAQGLVGVHDAAPLAPGQGPYALELVNNPFRGQTTENYSNAWIVGPGVPASQLARSAFSGHFFCLVTDLDDAVADATLGPFCGQIQLDDYLSLIVDPSCPDNKTWQQVLAQTNTQSWFMRNGEYYCD